VPLRVEHVEASGDARPGAIEQHPVVALDHAHGSAHDPRKPNTGTPAASPQARIPARRRRARKLEYRHAGGERVRGER
jgi:hypothetical protein